jgi:hypothetical protein
MARLVQSVLALVALVGFSQALNMSDFKSISGDKGVLDDWIKLEPSNGHSESDVFGLVYGNDKLYMVSRRDNKTALSGGIVSTLDKDGKWTHAPFNQLDEDQSLQDMLFTLSGRLFMLSSGEKNNRIVFSKLFVWDDQAGKWNNMTLDIPETDKVFQPLLRGPHKLVSINVADQGDKVAYIVATDHEMSNNNSETSFSKLEVSLDESTGKPLNASIKFINRILLDTIGKAVIATSRKDDRLYAMVATFSKDNSTLPVNISMDYAINLSNGSKVDVPALDAKTKLPYVDFTVSQRIFQLGKDLVLFLGPHTIIDQDHATRHVWELDMSQMKFQDIDAAFPNFPVRVYAIDQKNMRLLTAHPKKGAFAANIQP